VAEGAAAVVVALVVVEGVAVVVDPDEAPGLDSVRAFFMCLGGFRAAFVTPVPIENRTRLLAVPLVALVL
jgi:hypothetical protein